MSLIEIIIPNWKKFNPRSDRANYSWFRFENDFFHDQSLFGLTDSQIILFQLLICEASKKNKDVIQVNLAYFATFRKTTTDKISLDLLELNQRGVIVTVDSRLNDGKSPSFIPATNETNETNERTYSSAKADPTPVKEIGSEWNRSITHCPKFKLWPKSRDDAARRFLTQFSFEDWVAIVKKINESKFLSGQDSKWCAGIDWALKPANAAKILEGNYDNVGDGQHASNSSSDADAKKIFTGIKRFSSYESDDLREFLGEELFKRACNLPGGIAGIRQIPSGPFAVKQLVGLLREVVLK